MLHILLTILKILGILLLVLVGILLVIILSVLFVPVCYGAQGKKTADELYGKLSVSWLFRLIYAKFVYEDGETALEIFVFGIPLLETKRRLNAWKAERKKKKRKAKKADKKPAAQMVQSKKEPGGQAGDRGRRLDEAAAQAGNQKKSPLPEQTDGTRTGSGVPDKEIGECRIEEEPAEKSGRPETESGGKPEMEAGESKPESDRRKIRGIFTALWRLPGKIADRIRKIRLTFRGICDKIKQWYTFLQMDDTREAIRFLKEKGKGLIRHILPRKIRGNVVFGFDDPSLTGQVLAVAGAVYPLYKERLQIIPVFDRQVLEGEVKLSGRIFGGYLLWQAWQIYRNREVKVTYRRFQHKEA